MGESEIAEILQKNLEEEAMEQKAQRLRQECDHKAEAEECLTHPIEEGVCKTRIQKTGDARQREPRPVCGMWLAPEAR